MTRTLLTTTAIVAFAGAAAADGHIGTAWGADGEFGYNEEVEGGFYFDGGLAVDAMAEMDMGIQAGISLDVDLGFSPNEPGVNGGAFNDISINGSDFVIFVESDNAGLYIGDTKTASQIIWSGTTNMERDGFLEVGDVDDGADDGDFVDGVMRGDVTYGNVEASVSYFFGDSPADDDDLDGLTGMQIGATTTLGNFTVGAVYQEAVSGGLVNATDDDNNPDGIIGNEADFGADGNGSVDELYGIFMSTSYAGADIAFAYASNQTTDESSTGIEVSYPFGPVTAGVFYSAESGDIDDNYGIYATYEANAISVTGYIHEGNDEEIGLEGSYDAGNGLMIYAGYIQNDGNSDAYEAYVATTYDLGSNSELIVAYGDSGDEYTGDADEIGNGFEVNEGTTVAISFEF